MKLDPKKITPEFAPGTPIIESAVSPAAPGTPPEVQGRLKRRYFFFYIKIPLFSKSGYNPYHSEKIDHADSEFRTPEAKFRLFMSMICKDSMFFEKMIFTENRLLFEILLICTIRRKSTSLIPNIALPSRTPDFFGIASLWLSRILESLGKEQG